MHVNHGYSPRPAARYRALAIVLVVHLALGWWLLRGAATLEQPMRRSPLTPVLIQDVMIAPPAPQPQPPVRTPEAVVRQPAKAAPLRAALAPEPVLRPAAPAVREVRSDATVTPPTPLPAPTPIASQLLPSTRQVPETAGLPTMSQPDLSSAAISVSPPGAASTADLTRPGLPAPSQPQLSVPSGSASASSTVATPVDIALACPTQVPPVMPRLAVRGGITGVVQAQAVIVDGVVRDVRILSGPPVFHNAVRTAMRQYRCVSNRAEVLATQAFIFKID